MAVTDAYKHVFNDVAEFPRNITIDLGARYAAAFGMQAAGSLVNRFLIAQNSPNEYEVESYSEGEDFEAVKFEIPGSDIEPLEFGSVLVGSNVFASPLFFESIKQKKNLITTKVNDSDPVVIERWGTAPWEITMKGYLIDLNNRIYPSDEIRRLNRFWQQNKIVTVTGVQFEELDIDTILLTNVSFTRSIGFQDSVVVTMTAQSIKSVNFTLLKPNN